MNQKDFNLLLSNISNSIHPINQLLFECLVLFIFYYLFNTITLKNEIDKNSSNIKFIYLICLICILLDWFIWNNCIQTSLFISILIVYIIYNLNNSRNISTFINIVNDSRNINNINNQIENENNNNRLEAEYEKTKEQDKLNMITFIPKEIDYKNPNNNPNYKPNPYEKKLTGIYELNSAYSSGIPSLHLTDSEFAVQQLNNLYDTPQYKNIKKKLSDKSLDNYNEKDDKEPSVSSFFIINKNENEDEYENEESYYQDTNLELFRKPRREFLDSKWLDLKENTYNDNCKNCKSNSKSNTTNTNTNTNTNKNAICSVVKFGQELEECTNRKNIVNHNQLNKISNNKIEPIYKL